MGGGEVVADVREKVGGAGRIRGGSGSGGTGGNRGGGEESAGGSRGRPHPPSQHGRCGTGSPGRVGRRRGSQCWLAFWNNGTDLCAKDT